MLLFNKRQKTRGFVQSMCFFLPNIFRDKITKLSGQAVYQNVCGRVVFNYNILIEHGESRYIEGQNSFVNTCKTWPGQSRLLSM